MPEIIELEQEIWIWLTATKGEKVHCMAEVILKTL